MNLGRWDRLVKVGLCGALVGCAFDYIYGTILGFIIGSLMAYYSETDKEIPKEKIKHIGQEKSSLVVTCPKCGKPYKICIHYVKERDQDEN